MDLQKYVDGFYTLSCVVAVEIKENDEIGEVLIAAGNKRFVDIVEDPPYIMHGRTGNIIFRPYTHYELYFPRSHDFETLTSRCVLSRQPLYSFVHLNMSDMWFNIFVMPIGYEDDKYRYCTYSIENCNLSDITPISPYAITTSADVLKTCIKLHDTEDFSKTLQEVITDIRMICNAAVCTLMMVDTNSGKCNVLATSISSTSTLKRVTQFTNFYDIAMSWNETIGENDCIIVKNDADMEHIGKVNRPWYLTLKEANVQSLVMFPLRYNKDLLGYLWATNFDTSTTDRIKETLELTAFFLASELASYQMMNRLEHISYTDMLTGVNNRNCMNDRIGEMIQTTEGAFSPYGVVFADLNGLKRVNDTLGHSAGDLLLKKAAILLQEIFVGDEIYRAGGDEFMVISLCCKEEFETKVAILKARSSDPDHVCFAVGSCFCNEETDIREAMANADDDMYINKKQYYDSHPECRFR